MIRVLDLFAGTQSVEKALTELFKIEAWVYFNGAWVGSKYIKHENGKGENINIVEYIGVDIYSPQAVNTILDLADNNIIERLKRKLPKNWTPNFIWASPLCTTFSRATCITGGSLSYELDERERVTIRKKFSHITHKAYIKHVNNIDWQKEQQEKGKMGLNLLNNTKEIINYFNVPFAIENPANAMSKYELKDYTRNVTAYCAYGFPYKKATAIYSNQKLDLLKCNHKSHKQVMSGHPSKTGIEAAPSNNKDRSVVPTLLIQQILKQLLGGKNV